MLIIRCAPFPGHVTMCECVCSFALLTKGISSTGTPGLPSALSIYIKPTQTSGSTADPPDSSSNKTDFMTYFRSFL